MAKVNYLNNKDLLEEIHKSKNSYCSYIDPSYSEYDLILPSVDKINIRTIAEAKRIRAKKMTHREFERRRSSGDKKSKLSDCEVDYRKIDKADIVFRIMTFEHIPLAPGRKKKARTVADSHEKVNFPPFQHWKHDDQGNLICVGKSHWQGGMDNGHFNKDHGQFTNKLAKMFMKLCERYGTRSNVRGYTYNDEMRGQAILQLTQIGLQFDESKSQNPFAYYTAAVTNSFTRVINIEKRNQNIRDDILEMNNFNPSYTRQSNHEWAQAVERHNNSSSE
jgi:hypothetical protein